jgi:hypothetical protein
VVPLNQFTLAGGRLPAETLLSRDAFDRATGHDQISSSSSGSLPVATAAQEPTTNTDRAAQIAAGASPTPAQGNATTVATTNSPSLTGRANSASGSRETEPGRTNSNAIVGDSNDPSLQQNTPPVASTSAPANARTDRADTNGVNPAAVAANPAANPNPATINPEAAAQADAKSPTASPPFRHEQGQDIASTVPASPSARTPAQDTLTPTGRTSADQAPSTDPALNGAALAVRKALDDNPSLARLNVAVTPENGKVVLRGSVASAQLKTATEDTARRAAKGRMIDSELTIEGQ